MPQANDDTRQQLRHRTTAATETWRHIGEGEHVEHAHLFGGQARKAQVYPGGLFKAIVKGIKIQKEWDSQGNVFIGPITNLEHAKKTPGPVPPEEKSLVDDDGA